jgi:hypothetical protein
MFQKLFGKWAATEPMRSRVDLLAQHDLTKRPFTRALLLRTATQSDNIQKALIGTIDPPYGPVDIDDKVAVAVNLAMADILCDAMKETIGQSVFWPHEPLPKTTRLIVMFAFVVMTGFAGPLAEEGYEIDARSADATFVNSFFPKHSLEDRAKILQQAAGAFVEMHQANLPQVAEWEKIVRQTAQLYVWQVHDGRRTA